MAEHEVWGFKVATSPSGRKIWPNALKREATRRLREDGVALGDVAAELGAHECLVRKWWVADRRVRGEQISVEGPAFAQVSVPAPSVPVTPPATTAEDSAHLYIGSVCLQFPLSIDETDLLKLIRVAGQCQ